jgi:hypothetical protein
VRRITAWFDPCVTQEELSALLLGHRTYLMAKARKGKEHVRKGEA